MGCMQSKNITTRRAIQANALEQTNRPGNSVQQRRLQNVHFTLSGSTSDWLMFSQLQALHARAAALKQHIETYHINEPGLNAIYQAALDLYNDLGERTLYFEGDSPSRYQQRFHQITQTLAGSMPPFDDAQASPFTSPEVEPSMPLSSSSSPTSRPQTPLPR